MKLLTLLSAGLTGLALAGNPNDEPGWRRTGTSIQDTCPPSGNPTYTVETGFGVPTDQGRCEYNGCIWVRAAPDGHAIPSPNPEDGDQFSTTHNDRDRCCCEPASDDDVDGAVPGGNNRHNYNAAGESRGPNYCPNADDFRDISMPPHRISRECHKTNRPGHPGDNWVCEAVRDGYGRPSCCCHQRCDNPDAPFQYLTRGGPPAGAYGNCEAAQGCREQNGACCCGSNPLSCQAPQSADYSSQLSHDGDAGAQCSAVESGLVALGQDASCSGGVVPNGAWDQLLCCCSSSPIVTTHFEYDDGQGDSDESPENECPAVASNLIQAVGQGGPFNPIQCKSYGSAWGCHWVNGVGCCCKSDPDKGKGKGRRLLRA